ncbi:hypothetical protein BJY01DRAFT_28276 [Aspergillus pseudoustus]|uniref:Uncharacterized protein n=1 Tax=Aspergillus pseudoustus TaxID=1810923 RepID=A0ABR4JHJ0_9EURO
MRYRHTLSSTINRACIIPARLPRLSYHTRFRSRRFERTSRDDPVLFADTLTGLEKSTNPGAPVSGLISEWNPRSGGLRYMHTIPIPCYRGCRMLSLDTPTLAPETNDAGRRGLRSSTNFSLVLPSITAERVLVACAYVRDPPPNPYQLASDFTRVYSRKSTCAMACPGSWAMLCCASEGQMPCHAGARLFLWAFEICKQLQWSDIPE